MMDESGPPSPVPMGQIAVRANGFLTGLRVVELGEGTAVGFCGRLLADAGADVLKVEPPDGDAARRHGPFVGGTPHPERSLPFLVLHAGKRSLVLDPERGEDQQQLLELIHHADVVLDGSERRAGTRWHVKREALHRLNPGLVYAIVTPFGREGPYRAYRVEELTLYALGGLMYHIGAYDREPLKHGPAQAAYLTGLNVAVGVLLALLARDRDGLGQQVDVAAQACVALLLGALELPQYAYTGGVARREEKDGPGLNNIQPCADGYVVPIAFGAAWEMMAHFLDEPALLDPRFATAAARKAHEDELDRLIGTWTATRDRHEVMHRLQAAGIAAGAVQTTRDLFADPQLLAQGFFEWVDHSDRDSALGVRPYVGRPWRLARTPGSIRRRAPGLGEHNRAVLVNLLGQPEAALAAWAERGVIGEEPAEGTPVPEVASPDERIAQGRWAAWDPDFERRLKAGPAGTPICGSL